MMVHSDSRGGSLVLDRKFRDIGRIKRASGTHDARVFRRINKTLSDLYDAGRLDILRAVKEGALSAMLVHEAWITGRLHTLPLGSTAKLLAPAMRAWLELFRASEKHRESIDYSIRHFERSAPEAKVADLAHVVDELRVSIGARHPRMWNLLRSHAQAFVRETLKRTHPIYEELRASEPLKVKAKRVPHPLTLVEIRERFPAPDTDSVDGIAWGMATTGMLQHEYWGRWHVEGDRIKIEGTKRAARRRFVPFVMRPPVARMHRRTFENKVRERCPDMEARDFRNTYATWLEDAEIPRTRRRMYLGHGTKDVTDLYERREIAAFLAEDGAKVRGFLSLSHDKSHSLRRIK